MKGSCRCGSVQYRFVGKPDNIILCYCKECQLQTGSDKWFGAWIKKDNFKFIKGQPTINSRIGESGSLVNNMFCGQCGTPICVEVTVGNFYSVSINTMEKPESFSPQMAIYTRSAPKWVSIPNDIAVFDILPPRSNK